KEFKELELRVFKSSKGRLFHVKAGIFIDRRGKRTAILGSSNLTNGGLVENYEANVLITDANLANRLLDYFDEHLLGGHARRITADWLDQYRSLWLQRRKLVERLRVVREKVRRAGSQPTTEKQPPSRIKGHTFGFTGKIYNWPRFELYPQLEKWGAE